MKKYTIIFSIFMSSMCSSLMGSASHLSSIARNCSLLTRTLNKCVERGVLRHTIGTPQLSKLEAVTPKLSLVKPTPIFSSPLTLPTTPAFSFVQPLKKINLRVPTSVKSAYTHLNKIYKGTNKLLLRPLRNNLFGLCSTLNNLTKVKGTEFFSYFNKTHTQQLTAIQQYLTKLKKTPTPCYKYLTNVTPPPITITKRSRILDEQIFPYIQKGIDPLPFLLHKLGFMDQNLIITSLYNLFNLPPQVIRQIDDYFAKAVESNSNKLTMQTLTQTLVDHINPLGHIFGEPITPDNVIFYINEYITNHYNEIYYQHEFNKFCLQLFTSRKKILNIAKSIKTYLYDNYNNIDYRKAFQQFCLQLTTTERKQLKNFFEQYSPEQQAMVLDLLHTNNLTITWNEFTQTLQCPWNTRHYSKILTLTSEDFKKLAEKYTHNHKDLVNELEQLTTQHHEPRTVLFQTLRHLSNEALIGHYTYLLNFSKEKDIAVNEKFVKAYEKGGLESTPISMHEIREFIFKAIMKRNGISYTPVSFTPISDDTAESE